MRAGIALLLLSASVLAGCLGPAPEPAADADPDVLTVPPRDPRVPGNAAEARVVVAVIDTGINVYHDAFRRVGGLPEDLVATFVDAVADAPPERVAIRHDGDYEQRVEADLATWQNLTTQRLYYFEGTNVLGISFSPGSGGSFPVLDAPASHGTGTAGAVVAANPNAIIVLVEGLGRASEGWAAQQPWIDLVSMSYGPTGSIPTGAVTKAGTAQSTRAMWSLGQVPVGAADNTPALAPNDETAGPPWVVGVAGDHEATQCRDHRSATFPDFTSNFTQVLPRHDHVSETRSMSGTSFATPKTAGTFSLALLEVRRAWGHVGGLTDDGALAVGPDGQRLTNGGLWDAFNRTATYFDFFDCQPGGQGNVPVNPAAPWLQMGWGHIGHASVAPAVDHLLGVRQAPEKPPEATTFMEAWHAYRQNLWDTV